jgi:hypothetical protein
VAVALATEKKFNEYLDKLEGDGPEPTFAERLTITRAAHNWLAVHILECLMNQYELWGARAAALDKSLGRAERRLHASLQALAMLRRLRRPVVKQVNVANGPMLVNN